MLTSQGVFRKVFYGEAPPLVPTSYLALLNTILGVHLTENVHLLLKNETALSY